MWGGRWPNAAEPRYTEWAAEGRPLRVGADASADENMGSGTACMLMAIKAHW